MRLDGAGKGVLPDVPETSDVGLVLLEEEPIAGGSEGCKLGELGRGLSL